MEFNFYFSTISQGLKHYIFDIDYQLDQPKAKIISAPSDVYLDDLIEGISRIYRYLNRTVAPYSVLTHSVNLYNLFTKIYNEKVQTNSTEADDAAKHLLRVGQFYALCHDLPEAFTNDVPYPVVQLPGINQFLNAYQDAFLDNIYKHFLNLDPQEYLHSEKVELIISLVKRLDRTVSCIECQELRIKCDDWGFTDEDFEMAMRFSDDFKFFVSTDVFRNLFTHELGVNINSPYPQPTAA